MSPKKAHKPTKHLALQGNRARVPHRKETVIIKHLYTKKVPQLSLPSDTSDKTGTIHRMVQSFFFFCLFSPWSNHLVLPKYPQDNLFSHKQPYPHKISFSRWLLALSLSLSLSLSHRKHCRRIHQVSPKLRSLFSGTNLSRSLSLSLLFPLFGYPETVRKSVGKLPGFHSRGFEQEPVQF